MGIIILALVLLVLTPVGAYAQSAPTWTHVQQVFEIYQCPVCHTGEDAPLGLRLDTLEGALEGSENGPVLVAGKPSESKLFTRVGSDSEVRMPLTGPPFLSAEEISLLEQWIEAGLPTGDGDAAAATPQKPVRPGPNDTATFAHVKTIFMKRCVKCHKDKGLVGEPPENLRLGSYDEILKGGERLAILPGNPGLSELIRRVEGKAEPRMPMDGPPWLSDDDISLLRQWITQGARDENSIPAPIPQGRKVRYRGMMTGKRSIDGATFIIDGGTRIDKSPRVGGQIEVRGRVTRAGNVRAYRLRSR